MNNQNGNSKREPSKTKSIRRRASFPHDEIASSVYLSFGGRSLKAASPSRQPCPYLEKSIIKGKWDEIFSLWRVVGLRGVILPHHSYRLRAKYKIRPEIDEGLYFPEQTRVTSRLSHWWIIFSYSRAVRLFKYKIIPQKTICSH